MIYNYKRNVIIIIINIIMKNISIKLNSVKSIKFKHYTKNHCKFKCSIKIRVFQQN